MILNIFQKKVVLTPEQIEFIALLSKRLQDYRNFHFSQTYIINLHIAIEMSHQDPHFTISYSKFNGISSPELISLIGEKEFMKLKPLMKSCFDAHKRTLKEGITSRCQQKLKERLIQLRTSSEK